MPFSDNLYSMADDDSDNEPVGRHGHHLQEQPDNDEHRDLPGTGDDGDIQAYSPTDGYFHAASASEPSATRAAAVASNVPHVPNVWVRDPSLEQESTADGKAREAHRETLANNASLYPQADDRLRHSGSGDGPSTHTYQSSHRSSASHSSRAAHHEPSAAAYTPSSTGSYTSDTPRQQSYDQRSPYVPRDPPPAYSPSTTASPTSPTNSPAATDLSRNYRTFSQSSMGRPETQGLLARNPESMGGPGDAFEGVTPAWRERASRRLPYFNGRRCKVMLLGLALLAVTLGFLVRTITSVRNEKDQRPPFEDSPGAKQPDPQPIIEPPHMDYPVLDGDNGWPAGHFCKDLTIKHPSRSFDLSFGPGNNVSFVQDVEKDDTISGRAIEVSGDFVLRRSGEGTPGPSIVLDVITNDESMAPKIQFFTDPQALHVTVPRKLPWGETSTRPCMRIQATVWVPEDGTLDTLVVENVHLGIKLLDNLSLQVAQTTRLTTVVGPVVAAEGTDPRRMPLDNSAPAYFRFDSRWIEVKTTSAHIKGYWPLYDYLGLQSISGKIRVGIEPKAVNKDAPKPAVLYIKSLSGDVEFQEPIQKAVAASQQTQAQAVLAPEKWIPPRDYRPNIQTTSGDIKGSLAFSSTCQFHSTSGDVDIELLPALDPALAEASEHAELETSSTSGRITARVHDPLWIEASQGTYMNLPPTSKSPAMRCLRSRHTTTSANIKLHYPATWEGDLDLKTLSGKLKVRGKDVKKIKEGSDWPGVNKQLLARKGAEGGSYAMMKTISGDIDVTVD